MIKVSLSGSKEIDDVLRSLPLALTHQVVGAAHFAAAKPLVEREKLLAPEGPTGNLVDSIGAVKTSLKRANAIGEVLVGPRQGKGKNRKGFHGKFIEFGFRTRRKPGGKGKDFVRAKPFAAPAFRQEKGNVERLIAVSLGKSVLRTMRRYIK